MANLVELFDNIVQMQNLNGVPLANGKMYVYALGRTRLMDTWSDVDGESLNSNPIILDAAGQCHCYVSDDFDYTLVVTDAYGNEIFSIDKYLYSQGSHSHADVAVAPSETIAVSSYHVGETTVYVPYLTGQLGKVYEGIDPIVVNNVEDKISANHVPLGVQDPLYFVQDDEEGCIIGFSGQTIPEGVMSESGLGFENDKITGYNGSAFSAGNEYEAGSYVDITNNTISVTGLQPEGDYAYNSALSSKLDVTALPQDLVHNGDLTAYQPAGNYQTAGNYLSATDSANFYPMEGNPSGFLTAHQSLQGYATEQWVEGKGYLTAVDIPESANWNGATTVVNNNSAIWNTTTNIVSANSAQWTSGGTANPQIPVTGINGIKISESGDKVVFEVSADYVVADDLTGKQDSLTFGYKDTAISSIDNSALYDNSAHARINTLAGRISNKLDTTAFSDVSGSFLTAVPATYLQNTDLTITDGKVTEISGVPLSAGDELPSGVMNTSALEYNAVNEISAYNGSAIAQYGAEKQWLVHDDTLVHVANSAQYALGVNLSAVAQLLGIDETVLWSGTDFSVADGNQLSATVQLSEPISAFNELKIISSGNLDSETIVLDTTKIDGNAAFTWIIPEGGNAAFWIGLRGVFTDQTHLKVYGGYSTSFASVFTSNGWWRYKNIYKVIGIGRKA